MKTIMLVLALALVSAMQAAQPTVTLLSTHVAVTNTAGPSKGTVTEHVFSTEKATVAKNIVLEKTAFPKIGNAKDKDTASGAWRIYRVSNPTDRWIQVNFDVRNDAGVKDTLYRLAYPPGADENLKVQKFGELVTVETPVVSGM